MVAAKAGKEDFARLLGQDEPQDTGVGLEEVIHEAIRQTKALDRV